VVYVTRREIQLRSLECDAIAGTGTPLVPMLVVGIFIRMAGKIVHSYEELHLLGYNPV
jgi:hypothetical protein